MKTIYLHIGTHRTGTTSIQRFLARAEDALAEQGILYPEAGRPDTDWSDQYGQHRLWWSIEEKRGVEDRQVWGELRREIDDHSGRCIVISAEGFGKCTSEEVQEVISHLVPYPLRVIVYLRPPLDFLRSAYKQRVKMGTYRGSFLQFVREMIPRCNYLDLVSRWEQFDRVESVDIRLFDKVKSNPGLEASFADAMGIDFEGVRSFFGAPTNTSPPDHLVRVARRINAVSTLGDQSKAWRTLAHRARRNVLHQRWPGRWLSRLLEPFLHDSLGTNRAVDVVREEIEDVHERFLDEYVDPDDRVYLTL